MVWMAGDGLLESHLALAEQHVALGERHIVRQLQIISEFETAGFDTSVAESVLDVLVMTQMHHRKECERLREQLVRVNAELAKKRSHTARP